MPTDTRTSELVLNVLSKQDYDNIPNPDPNQLYLVPEEEKANVDANNFTSAGTTYLSKIGYMDWSRMENLPIPATGTTITAPANGWLWGNIAFTAFVATVIFETVDSFGYNLRVGSYTDSSGRIAYALLPVRQGDKLTILWSTNGTNKKLVFIYAEGNPTPSNP